MPRIFVAVLAAILVAQCVLGAEPDAYEQFKAGCERVNADQGAPAGWCDCLVAKMRGSVPEADLAAALEPVAPAEVFFVVQQKVAEAAGACRAQFRGDVRL